MVSQTFWKRKMTVTRSSEYVKVAKRKILLSLFLMHTKLNTAFRISRMSGK